MLAEKYKPKSLKEFVNQTEVVKFFLNWMKSKKREKALLFFGPPGVGKTALVEAYANENNLDLIEMNASDFRSAEQIREVIGQSMKQAPLGKKGKIFLIDEVDGLVSREDYGGAAEIAKIIRESAYPVILTANTPWSSKLKSLRPFCTLLQFHKISVWDVKKRLQEICRQEKIQCSESVLLKLAQKSDGDLRSAINDLETISQGKKIIREEDLEVLSKREREVSIFDALKIIFKTKSTLAAKLAVSNVDKDPDEIFWWIENNIAREYENPEEIAKAFDALSKADLFRQRIRSRQDWRLLAYAIDLMTAGVAVAKREVYKKFTRYEYPSTFATLASTKEERSEEREKILELAKKLHCSTKTVRRDVLPFLKLWK
jgi:replication factor C large subunit